ncbi:MAG: hypothetical protein E2O73_14355 [Deltaproteobacteria bacterium]|nr:MAG: hypothetical protein E2O73_14355 [Deltaproteobacteria bacterium]
MRVSIILIGLGLVLGFPTSAQAVDPDTKCESDKIKTAGKYSGCLMGTYSKAVKKGEVPDFTKCDSKYSAKWQKAETKAGGACPTDGDEAAIQAQVQQCADDLVAVLGSLPPCPGGAPEVGGACWYLGLEGESCDGLCNALGLGYDPATAAYAGTGGSLPNCDEVMDALGDASDAAVDLDCGLQGAGCAVDSGAEFRLRCTSVGTDSSSSIANISRACACQ